MKRKERIKIYRSEQWEYTAYIGKGKKRITATSSSEQGAELRLLRKIVYGTDKVAPTEEV